MRASLVSARCLLRGLPLFFRAAPRTPLRVLGIVALDTIHVLRHARPLPRTRISALALFMDFEGFANAAWDHKALCEAEFEAIRRRLQQAGLGRCVEAYLDALGELETRRPAIGGSRCRFGEVKSYREAVARLSLTTAAAIALNADGCPENTRAVRADDDVDTLFRILMQCQIIDDVVDHAEDVSAGLPSFLTASASLAEAIEMTAAAARSYAAAGKPPPGGSVFPLRVALSLVTAVTRLVVGYADRRNRHARQFARHASRRRMTMRRGRTVGH